MSLSKMTFYLFFSQFICNLIDLISAFYSIVRIIDATPSHRAGTHANLFSYPMSISDYLFDFVNIVILDRKENTAFIHFMSSLF